MIRFDIKVYGTGGGVMHSYEGDANSAEECVQAEAEYYKNNSQVGVVACWAKDRKSGHCQIRLR